MIPISEGGLGAYWTARREDVTSCAERLLRCLNGLRAASPAFASWLFTQGRTRKSAALTLEGLHDLLLAGRNRKDFPPREIIEELGYSSDLATSPSPQEQISFRVVCGMYASDPALLNHCLVKFAAKGDLSYDSVPLDVKTRALAVLVESWDPDWAALRSRRLSMAVRSACGNTVVEPYFGWVTYISYRQGTLPQSIRDRYPCEALLKSGELVYVSREAFDDQNPQLIRAAADLYGLLKAEGLLNRNTQVTSGK